MTKMKFSHKNVISALFKNKNARSVIIMFTSLEKCGLNKRERNLMKIRELVLEIKFKNMILSKKS